MPKLLVRHPEKGDLKFTLSGERIAVGRRADNAIRIDHGTVSGHHAELVIRNGRYIIRDLGSTNHSYIEGVMFIEAELDRPCRLILGTIECEYLPDEVETIPEGPDSLRKAVGLLRRQNDDLVAKISVQQNQINILGNARLLTPEAGATLESLREQVKTLTADRDRLASENKDLMRELLELRSIFAGGEKSKAMSGGRTSSGDPTPQEPAAGVIVPIFTEQSSAKTFPEAEASACRKIALLNEKLRSRVAALALQPSDRNTLGVMLDLAEDMHAEADALGTHPVATIVSDLAALLGDAGRQSGPMDEGVIRTAAQSMEFLSKLLTEDVLSRAADLPPPRVIAVDDDRELLPAIISSLKFANLPTIGCSDAQQALDTLQETHCDLILVDIGLPDMSGLDMCARIRALPKHDQTPIVFLTGQDTENNRQKGALTGASDFIGKPFNMFELTLKAHTWALKNQLAVA